MSPVLAAAAAIPMRFERLGLDEGLSQQTVNAIAQDPTGFLWLGTEGALDRYDGYSVLHVRHDRADTRSLPNDFITDIRIDADGQLWVATDGGGVVRRDARRGTAFHQLLPGAAHLPELDRVRVIRFDRAGRLWIGSRDAGLAVLDPVRNVMRRFRHDAADAGTLSSDSVSALLEDRLGRIWVGTQAGFDRLDLTTGRFQRYRLPSGAERVRALLEDHTGDLWIGSESGLARLDQRSGQLRVHRHDAGNPGSLPADRVNALLEDRQHRLWVGTSTGLALLERESGTFVTYRSDPADPGSLPDDHILSLFEDRGGLLWVGTRFGGTAKWNPRTWSFGNRERHNVAAFTVDAAGRLWIGTVGSGLIAVDRASGAETVFSVGAPESRRLADDRVIALLTDRDGAVWAGTVAGGLQRIAPGTLKVTTWRHDPADPATLGAPGVMSLLEASNGDLWVGTYGGGLSRRSRGSEAFQRYTPDPDDPTRLMSGRITALLEDRAGRIWAGTDGGGLHIFDPTGTRFFRFRHDSRNPDSLSADTVYALHLDEQGTVWVGTRGGGLDRVVGSSLAPEQIRFTNVSEQQGLPNRTIYGIRPDTARRLWLSTNHGLARFDPHSGEIRSFHRRHGLQGEVFTFGAHYATPDGELFFGGAEGYNAFRPGELQFNEAPPPVVLTAVLKRNRPAAGDMLYERLASLRLAPGDGDVTFEFAALDFAAPRANTFRYKLEGFDADWVEAGARRSVTYANLNGGEYTLRVRAANADGTWNDAGPAIKLQVDPPLWASKWAFLSYALAAALLVWGSWVAHRRMLERRATYSRRLEENVLNRTRELAEQNRELERVNRRLEQVSLSDPLTGLGNRRSLVQAMPNLIADTLGNRRSGRSDGQMTLMLVDLDRLKPINDEFGHEAGDQVLAEVSSILRDSLRETDRVVRWGGDEFVIVCAQSDLDGGAALAERVRSSIAARRFRVSGADFARTSCSIGYACYPFVVAAPHLLSWEQVLNLADMALYRAKSRRNAWVGWRGTAAAAAIPNLFSLLEKDPEAAFAKGAVQIRTSEAAAPQESIEALLRKPAVRTRA